MKKKPSQYHIYSKSWISVLKCRKPDQSLSVVAEVENHISGERVFGNSNVL